MNIEIQDDFDLKKIAESGQCFRCEDRGNGAWRIPYRELCLNISPAGTNAYALDCSHSEWESVWRIYFDLDTDYRSIRRRIDPLRDPFLYRASEAGKGIRLLRQDPWETLVSFIISQNRNIPALRRSISFLCQAAGEKRRDRTGEAFDCFPASEAILALDDSALAACRLGYRAKYVRAAASAAAEGRFDPESLMSAPEAETVSALTGLYGVGRKVAACVSLFGLHHLDAFPVDVWMRRVLETEYPDGYPMELYRPVNGIFQQYMFAYYRSLRNKLSV